MNYKILILSRKENNEIEDIYIKNRLIQDGNHVDIKWIDYDESLDDKYDLIIRRNAWVEELEDTTKYSELNKRLINRLISKGIKTVNLVGLDGLGKYYLQDLYHKNLKVIPTTNNIKEALSWNYNSYILKLKDSFGSGIGQKSVLKENLKEEYNIQYLIQPKLDFKSEVQTYFINNKLMYALEYTPSKYPTYPEPILIELSKNEEELAKNFASLSDIKVGMKRIDFLRLDDNSLILMEIEDNSPHMSIETLNEELKSKVLDHYVNGIYSYIKQ